MRLIDAESLLGAMYHKSFETDTDLQRWDGGCWIRYKLFQETIDEEPTVDAVRVIRCKDCQYHSTHRCYMAYDLIATDDEDYCSRGERREDNV